MPRCLQIILDSLDFEFFAHQVHELHHQGIYLHLLLCPVSILRVDEGPIAGQLAFGNDFCIVFDALVLYFLSYAAVLEGIQGFLVELSLRRHTGYHHRLRIAPKGLFENSCEFGIPERHISIFSFSQNIKAFT